MNPVIQQDRTGCGIACVAALTNQDCATVKKTAAALDIAATDPQLWSDTRHIRRLLAHYQIATEESEVAFISWAELPDLALLAIKWHHEESGPAWHWVVFVRDASGACVLDPKRTLCANRRTDFGRMKPKWYIRLRSRSRSATSDNRGCLSS